MHAELMKTITLYFNKSHKKSMREIGSMTEGRSLADETSAHYPSVMISMDKHSKNLSKDEGLCNYLTVAGLIQPSMIIP